MTPAKRIRGYMMLGEVVARDDPEGLGRVRVHVAGILEPSSVWALPIGPMRGVKQGVFWVPDVGTNGVVWLNQGDADAPYFLAGNWGAPGGVSDLPEQAAGGDPDVVVFRWRDFVAVVDGRTGAEKTTFRDLVTGTRFEIDRATGNFVRTIAGPQGDETATIKRNLVETIQTGNETHDVTLGSRATTIGTSDTKTTGGDEVKTIGGGRTEAIVGTETKTVGGASTETVTLGKTIAALLAVAISAGLGMALTAGGAIVVTAAGITLNSSGATSTTSTGLATNSFLGGILETIVGAVVRSVTGAVTETVSGLWTMVVNGGLLIQGAAIQLGTGAPSYQKLLNASYHTLVHLPHTHIDSTGHPTGGASAPSPADLATSETQDVTAS